MKCDPILPIKLVRYSGEVNPHNKGNEKHYKLHNEIRSGRFEKEEYNFEIYDKHKALMSDVRKGYPVSQVDLERSKNLIRCEIQLKRPYLLIVEKRMFGFDNGHLIRPGIVKIAYLLRNIWERTPGILYHRIEDLFGDEPWYHVDDALKIVQESHLDDSTKELIEQYIKSANKEEVPRTYSEYQRAKIRRTLKLLAINIVIIPDRILNTREYARLPYAPLCSKVQGIRENL